MTPSIGAHYVPSWDEGFLKDKCSFTFGAGPKWALQLTHDGRLIPGPGLSLDEVSQATFRALQTAIGSLTRKQDEEIKTLKDALNHLKEEIKASNTEIKARSERMLKIIEG